MGDWGEHRQSRLILVCYDISDPRRLRRVARICEGFGARAQRSVFECFLDERQLRALQRKLDVVLNRELDRIDFIRLCGKCRSGIHVEGCGDKPVDWDYHTD